MESIISLVTNKLETAILLLASLLALALLAKKYRLSLREVLREMVLRETKKGLLLREVVREMFLREKKRQFQCGHRCGQKLAFAAYLTAYHFLAY